MISAPDMLGFSGGPGPGMMSNPDPDPNSLYAMSSVSTNPSTPGNAGGTAGPPYQQTMPIPQTGGQQVRKQLLNYKYLDSLNIPRWY